MGIENNLGYFLDRRDGQENLTNLYNETLEALRGLDKTFNDVKLIMIEYQDQTELINKDDFIEVSKTINYDSDYGMPEINEELKIVGEDWWLERKEYDGSEGWVYKETPKVHQANRTVLKSDIRDLLYAYAGEEDQLDEVVKKVSSFSKEQIKDLKDIMEAVDNQDLINILSSVNDTNSEGDKN